MRTTAVDCSRSKGTRVPGRKGTTKHIYQRVQSRGPARGLHRVLREPGRDVGLSPLLHQSSPRHVPTSSHPMVVPTGACPQSLQALPDLNAPW